jgi:hypothetical protein
VKMNGVRGSLLVLAVLLSLSLSYFANPSLAEVNFDLKLDLNEFGRFIWDIWRSLSTDAKATIPLDDLLREMNLLVAQRESFIPRFERAADLTGSGGFSAPSVTGFQLRAEAIEMQGTVRRIQDMLRRVEPRFAAAHSDVHIRAAEVLADRAPKADETVSAFNVSAFNPQGARIDLRDLIQRLKKGTCDLRQVIHDMRVAAGHVPSTSDRDRACGVT